MTKKRLGVLISGRGSNLQALMAAAVDPDYPAEIALVLSNRADAAGLGYAARAGIAHRALAHPSREAFATAADRLLREHAIEFIALAGYMRLLDEDFVAAWQDRLVNIHPSLLPAFPGLHAQRQALAAGVRISGCTVHFVRAEVDTGPIIAQAAVPVRPEDDEASLSARILAAEHRVYPLAVRLLAEGRLRVAGNTVVVAGADAPDFVLFNPLERLASAAG